jgi:hypothetical protein
MTAENKYVSVNIAPEALTNGANGRHSVHVIVDKEKQATPLASFISYRFAFNTKLNDDIVYNHRDLTFMLWKKCGMSRRQPIAIDHIWMDPTANTGSKFTALPDTSPACYGGPRVWPFEWKLGETTVDCTYTQNESYQFIRVHTVDPVIGDKVITGICQELINMEQARRDAMPKPPIVVRRYIAVDQPYAAWLEIKSRAGRPLNTVHLDGDSKENLFRSIKKFLTLQELYERFGVTWKRVHLFEGPPGTGKTSLVLALASQYNYGISKITITPKMTAVDVEALIRKLPDKTFLLIEDVDSLFTKRTATSALDFSTLLNSLDGTSTPSGLIAFMTTNHVDKLDPALVRPGRVDMVVKFVYPTIKEIEDSLKHLASEFKHEHAQFLEQIKPYIRDPTKEQDTSKIFSIAGIQQYIFECILLERTSILNHINDLIMTVGDVIKKESSPPATISQCEDDDCEQPPPNFPRTIIIPEFAQLDVLPSDCGY